MSILWLRNISANTMVGVSVDVYAIVGIMPFLVNRRSYKQRLGKRRRAFGHPQFWQSYDNISGDFSLPSDNLG